MLERASASAGEPTMTETAFVPGRGVGLIGRHTLALLEPMNAALGASLWTLVEQGAGVDELLEELSATGLRALGSFVMVQYEGAAVRVVVRGKGEARIEASDGAHVVAAADVRTWHEMLIAAPHAVHLHLGEVSGSASPFHVDRGLVPASELVRDPRGVVPVTQSAVEAVAVPTTDDVLTVDPEPAPTTPLAPPAPDSSSTLSLDEFLRATEADSDVEPDVEDEPTTEVSVVASAPPPPPPPSVPVVEVAGVDEHNEHNEYDDMWGHTMVRPVESAAVRQLEAELHEAGAQDAVVAGTGATPLIAGVPAAPKIIESPAPPTPGSAADQLGDHDGRTMTRAQIQALRSGATDAVPSNAPAMGGPSVQALMCPGGHPNPPHLSRCRLCSQALASSPVLVARPLLGSLRFSNGTVVNLDRPALIGRNPKLEGALPSELPTLVRLEVGHGLSRSHALVRIEGWQVLIEDLNSANGTIVQSPGRQPQRLHPGEPMLLEHRSSIDLGGEINCVVELL